MDFFISAYNIQVLIVGQLEINIEINQPEEEEEMHTMKRTAVMITVLVFLLGVGI